MKIKLLFVMFAVLALTAFSAAQDGAKSALQGSLVDAVGLPGQGWTSLGNLSPIEHNNSILNPISSRARRCFPPIRVRLR